AKRTDITDVDGVTVEKTTPEIPDDFLNVMVEWSDFVCLARITKEGQRVMMTRESERALAKNRYSLPEYIALDWASFEQAVVNSMPHPNA
ncbi:MAG: hypothetical protein ABIH86_01110, partial [Planctomycetota bacterium]